MKIAYIAHSVTNGYDNTNVINHLVNWLMEKNFKVEKPTELSIFQDYLAQKSIKSIKNMDIIIADVSNYSHGVGFELGYAFALDKNIIVMCHNSSKEKLSKFLVGLFPEMIYYNNENDLLEKISEKIIKLFPPNKNFF